MLIVWPDDMKRQATGASVLQVAHRLGTQAFGAKLG